GVEAVVAPLEVHQAIEAKVFEQGDGAGEGAGHLGDGASRKHQRSGGAIDRAASRATVAQRADERAAGIYLGADHPLDEVRGDGVPLDLTLRGEGADAGDPAEVLDVVRRGRDAGAEI